MAYDFVPVGCVSTMTNARDLSGDACRVQDEVDTTRSDGARRHAIVFGRAWFLGERNPALTLDGRQAERAVRCGSGEDNADRIASVSGGQRAQKSIDGCINGT